LVNYENGTLQELSHVDFGDDRVIGVCAVRSNKVVFCTTAQGRTHELSYDGKAGSELSIVSTTQTALVAEGEEQAPSQRAIGANPAGDTLLISQGSTVNVWKYNKGNKKALSKQGNIKTEEVHQDDIRDVMFSPKDGLFLTCDDGVLALWNLNTGKLITKCRPSDSTAAAKSPVKLKFRGAMFNSDGTQLLTAASGAKGGYLTTRGVSKAADWTAKAARDRLVTPSPITSVDLSPLREGSFAVGTAEGEVCVIDQKSLSCVCRLEAHGMPVTKVTLLTSGDCFSVAFDNNCALTCTKKHIEVQTRKGMLAIVFVLCLLFVFLYLFYALLASYAPPKALSPEL